MGAKFDIVYCPFYEADVFVWSEMIDKLGTFPVFVLTSISENLENPNVVRIIEQATNLNPSNVLETIEDLIHNGLLNKQSDSDLTYCLTDLGKQYVRINNYLENYSQNTKVAINAFTGIVEDVKNKNCCSSESPNKDMTLPVKIKKFLINNHNFSNIKEYMKNRINLSDFHISDSDYDYIFFDLKPSLKIFYVSYMVPENVVLLDKGRCEYPIRLILPIAKVTKEITHPEVEKRKNIIDNLIEISKYEEDLLSEQGKYIMGIVHKIDEQKKKEPIYFEYYSGTKIKLSNDLKQKIPEFKLSKRKKTLQGKPHEKDGFIITNQISEMETSRLVSFYDLIQVEDPGMAAKDDSTTADVVKDSSVVPITRTDKNGTTTATLTEE